jgi:DNA-binding CsgD family transcriptional regulator
MPLLERETERARIAELVDGIRDRGGALLVRGEAGIGKSALLATIEAPDLRTLTATGVEAEHHLPYSGLHQLLFPLRDEIHGLASTQREGLRTALGLADGPRPEIYLVGMAVLNLLAQAASTRPLLLVVDDLQWLDVNSQEVLAFVARRLESEPIVLVAAFRDDEPSRMDTAGLPTLRPGPLSPGGAATLVDAVAPNLSLADRARVLAAAGGNPLALRELCHGELPATSLEHSFGTRLHALPADTRKCLVIAAVNETNVLAETLNAAKAELAALSPAVGAGLIIVTTNTVEFRHPLIRSAIIKHTDPCERHTAQRALAEVLGHERDRQIWHRAAATTEPDDVIAAELEDSADRAWRRGGNELAVSCLERAAQLSACPDQRAFRFLRAAGFAVEAYRPDLVDKLLAEASSLDLDQRQRALVAWMPTTFDEGGHGGRIAIGELVDLATGLYVEDGRPGAALWVLWSTATRCFWLDPDPHERRRIIEAADRLPIDPCDPRVVAINAHVVPFERGESVLAGLHGQTHRMRRDSLVDRFLADAALHAGAFDLSARFAGAALPALRARGRLPFVVSALCTQAWSCARLGDLVTAQRAADEASRLVEDNTVSFVPGLVLAVQAEIAALQGDSCDELACAAERIGLTAGARPVLATVQLARGIAALGEHRYTDAFLHLMRLHDPSDPCHQMALRWYAMAELVEAAAHCDELGTVGKLLPELEMHAATSPSPALHIGLRYARAVMAPDHEAEKLYRAALDADLCAWPLERGRVQLAYGEWLRRQRRIADSRPQLRAARETFDALGVTRWAERARRELRATGESGAAQPSDCIADLTPQELTIARLAGQGLTNREIGAHLRLSHRTVGTHLHRLFPKLGITSRGELRDVMRQMT